MPFFSIDHKQRDVWTDQNMPTWLLFPEFFIFYSSLDSNTTAIQFVTLRYGWRCIGAGSGYIMFTARRSELFFINFQTPRRFVKLNKNSFLDNTLLTHGHERRLLTRVQKMPPANELSVFLIRGRLASIIVPELSAGNIIWPSRFVR